MKALYGFNFFLLFSSFLFLMLYEFMVQAIWKARVVEIYNADIASTKEKIIMFAIS